MEVNKIFPLILYEMFFAPCQQIFLIIYQEKEDRESKRERETEIVVERRNPPRKGGH
jgi:hypothetical protein